MGLFDLFKKQSTGPYRDESLNHVYELLFCDNIELYRDNTKLPGTYPFDILFSESSSVSELQRIIDDTTSDSRLKILAYNRQLSSGHKPEKKELLAVIVEVGLDNGLDVLASFKDGTARYFNQSGKLLIWETKDEQSEILTAELFAKSESIVQQIGPWDQPRRPFPPKGKVRITFLVSDGLYFGEGMLDKFFNDPMAAPALTAATHLMQYLMERSLETKS